MVWAIIVVAVIVLGIGAYAGTGKLGQLPEVVNDSPKGVIPEGPVDEAFLEKLRIPRVISGYSPSAVDQYLGDAVAGREVEPVAHITFPVVKSGYDMTLTDIVLDRLTSAECDRTAAVDRLNAE